MKLLTFSNSEFIFTLTFQDHTTKTVNLKPLVDNKVDNEDLATATIDPEWGCLEFKNGLVDIEPKTLYQYAINHST